jgi:hypothetical protein
MISPEPATAAHDAQAPERGAALTLLPIAATGLFYLLPAALQQERLVQFLPQLLAYVGLTLWCAQNRNRIVKLGLPLDRLRAGLLPGILAGIALGTLNVLVILRIVPWIGYDIAFLTSTPHAKIPFFMMVPWFILFIAVAVELNFRGFLLGRTLALCRSFLRSAASRLASSIAIGTSALVFAFDPFMVATFHHLHWIAVWDGVIWGIIWVRLGNLYATIIAHAVEVLIVYSVVRAALQ